MADERALKLALQIVKEHYPEMPADYRGRRVQIALAAIKLTTKLAAEMATEHRARVPGYTANDGDKPLEDLVAQGYGNAALNIEIALRNNDHLPADGGENV